jgi:hypothetical protein
MPRPGRFVPGKDIRWPSCRRLDELQGRSGGVWEVLMNSTSSCLFAKLYVLRKILKDFN